MLTPCFYTSTEQPLTWQQTFHNVAAGCLYTPYFHEYYEEIDCSSLERKRKVTVITSPWEPLLTVFKVILAATIIAPLICYFIAYPASKQNWQEVDLHFEKLTHIEKEMFLIDFLKNKVDKECNYSELYQIAEGYRKEGLETGLHNHLLTLAPKINLVSKMNVIGYDFNHRINDLIYHQDVEGLRALLKAGFPPNRIFYPLEDRTILHHAAYCNRFFVMTELIQHLSPEQLNVQDRDGRTALSYCSAPKKEYVTVYHGQTPIIQPPRVEQRITEKDRFEMIETLITHGANANIPDKEGYLPLHYVVLDHKHKNRIESIKILAKYTKNNVIEFTKALPLAVIIKNVELAKFFIENGAKLDIAERDSRNTLLHIAAGNSDSEFKPAMMELLLNHVWSFVYTINEKGETPLHLAAYSCNLEMVKFLTARGARANILTHENKTPKDTAQKSLDTYSLFRVPKAKEVIHFLSVEEIAGPQLRFHFKIKAAGILGANFAILPVEVQKRILDILFADTNILFYPDITIDSPKIQAKQVRPQILANDSKDIDVS